MRDNPAKDASAKREAGSRGLLAALLCAFLALIPSRAAAKVYIDIVSSPRKLPIAIQEFQGAYGSRITAIVSEDLRYSGLFLPVESDAFLEGPVEPFKRANWAGTGAEAVVKGSVTAGEKLVVRVMLYDVFEGRLLYERKYNAPPSMLRPLAHAVAGDIYREITGRGAAFKTKIAYVTQTGERHELNIADWDGKRRNNLGISSSALLAPHWSDDGGRLLYSAQRGRQWGIYLLDFGRMKESRVFSSRGINVAGDFLPGGESFTLSSSRAGTPDIYIYGIKSRKLKRLTSGRGIEVSPSVSRNGKKVAYVSDRGGNPQIYTIDKFGYNKSRVTFEGNYNTSPAWSPGGDRIAFCGRYNGKNQIFTVRPDGSELRLLTDSGNNEEPSFSPDGRFIAFTSDRDGTKGVYTMRANGEAQRRISPPGLKAFGAGWSPK
jgi:TolB protein